MIRVALALVVLGWILPCSAAVLWGWGGYRPSDRALAAVASVLAVALLLVSVSGAQGQGYTPAPDLDRLAQASSPYDPKMRAPGSGLRCCGPLDCRPVKHRWAGRDELLLNDQWWTVEDGIVLWRQPIDEDWHICIVGGAPTCVYPPNMGS